MPQTILISACLLGTNCRYDGKGKAAPVLLDLLKDYRLVPFCPETLGGLPIPRPPAEIKNGSGAEVLAGVAKVVNNLGQEVTRAFLQGAHASLEEANLHKPCLIIGKSNSPSCGVGQIYDGSFCGRQREGDGVTTALLRQAGFPVFLEVDVLRIPDQILDKNYG